MILGYVRVSTDDQAKPDRASPEEQERVIRGYAMMKGVKAFDITVFSDLGISGSVPLDRRPQGAALLATAKKGDVVVAAKLDRLFRSASDALNTAESLKRQGIDLVLTDIGNEAVTANGSAKLFFGILASIAEFERERIVERITVGKRAKVARGGCDGGQPPYGFDKVGMGRSATLRPNDREQLVLTMIHNLRKEGNSPYQIMKILKEQRVKNRGHSPFQMNQVQRLLTRRPLSQSPEVVNG
jgi:site-specific DNA recombinase